MIVTIIVNVVTRTAYGYKFVSRETGALFLHTSNTNWSNYGFGKCVHLHVIMWNNCFNTFNTQGCICNVMLQWNNDTTFYYLEQNIYYIYYHN